MPKVDQGIIAKRFWWYRIWQYLLALLLFLSIPAIASYLCWMFQLPTDIYYVAGAFFLLQIILLYLSPKLILNLIASYPEKYRKVTPENQPRFYERLVNLAKKSEIGLPDVYIIDSETANAFALKIFGGNYIACITSKLMEILDEEEQEAVMAHEFGHIANDDVKLTMYLAVFNILLKIANKHVIDMIIKRGIEKSAELKETSVDARPKTSAIATVEAGGFWVIFGTVNVAYQILTYFPYVVAILFARVMQQKEYRADGHAANTLGDTAKMKSALLALEKYSERLPMFPASLNPLFAVPVSYHFFVWPLLLFPTFRDNKDALKEPAWGRRLRNLFESHPLVYDRIKRLESYEKE